MKKRLLFSVLSLLLVVSMSVTSVFAEVSKDTTATALTDDDTTTVTLSLPAGGDIVPTDVLFVMDTSSCADATLEKTQTLVNKLLDRVDETGATVNVGFVMYKGVALSSDFKELNKSTADSFTTDVQAVKTELESNAAYKGGNMHGALLEAQRMLEADTTTPDDRKIVILISDGIAYSWDQDGVQKSVNTYDPAPFPKTLLPIYGSYWSYENYHLNDGGYSFAPADNDWAAYFNTHKDEIEALATSEYAVDYTRDYSIYSKQPVPDVVEDGMCCVDVALYKAYQVYEELSDKYVVSAVCCNNNTQYGKKFMDFLNDGEGDMDTIFENVDKSVTYSVAEGSTVVDTIGNSFDLTDINSFNITVDGTALNKKVDGNTVYFGTASEPEQYVITYEDGDTEKFTLAINTSIRVDAQVKVSYDLKLIRESEPGEYTVPTNESAILYPVNTKGEIGEEEYFPQPMITYTVEASDTPKSNDKDNVSTDAPETSASGSTAFYFGMMALAAAGIVTVSKRNK